ncbi:addiction module protein [Pendulispora albinea]|uniref:Addiction module protein n=1 Tax=Pendulispora albinea TaxID=2741071 RepID=A0ABZ2LQN0_9BACT
MNTRAKRVLMEAMALSTKERAEIASELLATLEDQIDADAEEAWGQEIERRVRESLSGVGKTRDLNEALDDIQARLRTRA